MLDIKKESVKLADEAEKRRVPMIISYLDLTTSVGGTATAIVRATEIDIKIMILSLVKNLSKETGEPIDEILDGIESAIAKFDEINKKR